jgi:hypothetical protein
MYIREIDQGEQRKPRTESFMQLSEQLVELVNVFNEASRNIKFIFLLNKEDLKNFNNKRICACSEELN